MHQNRYGKGSSVMPWVQAPVSVPFYTIRSSDIGSDVLKDPTSYTPNQWNPGVWIVPDEYIYRKSAKVQPCVDVICIFLASSCASSGS